MILISNNLKRLRQYRGLSQQELGAAVGLSGSQISRFERNVTPISAGCLYLLAKALEVPLACFFDGLPPSRHQTEPGHDVLDVSDVMTLEAVGVFRVYNSLPLEQKRSVQGYVQRLAERCG